MSTLLDAEIAGTTLPIAPGAAKARLPDLLVDGLLDYVAFLINADLSSVLDKVIPRKSSAPAFVAVPEKNRFAYDPYEPRANYSKLPVPGLWLWWDGNDVITQKTAAVWVRKYNLNMLYVLDELPSTNLTEDRINWWSMLTKTLMDGSAHQTRPDYSFNSKPPGTSLTDSISDPDNLDWEYVGGRGLRRVGIDDNNQENLGQHVSGRHYPGFAAMFSVEEALTYTSRVELVDSQFENKANGVKIFDGVLKSPDGSEQL